MTVEMVGGPIDGLIQSYSCEVRAIRIPIIHAKDRGRQTVAVYRVELDGFTPRVTASGHVAFGWIGYHQTDDLGKRSDHA